jgi:hypothetical protein
MRLSMKATLAFALLCASLPAVAQQVQQDYPVVPPREEKAKERAETAPKPATPVTPDRAPRQVAVPGRASLGRASADARGLAGIRAISFGRDEVQLQLPGGAQRLHLGDRFQGYVVRSVEPGRMVLIGEAAPNQASGGEDVAVLDFGADGRARVVLYRGRPTAPASPPEVR